MEFLPDTRVAQRFASLGVGDKFVEEAQILCLPEGFLSSDDFYETGDMDNLIKDLKDKGLKIFSLIDAGVEVKSMDRRAKERWLGTVWIRDKAAVPFLISVLAGLSVAGISKAMSRESEPEIVHMELIIGREGEVRMKYDGPADRLAQIVEAAHKKSGP